MTVILFAAGMKMWIKRDERWSPSCRRDAITGHPIPTIRHHCPPSTKTFVELIFDSSDSANNFNLIGIRLIKLLLPLEMHFSFHGLSDFSNVTAFCAKDHELCDNHLPEEISRVYYLRSIVTSTLTIRFYTISSYASCRQADTWEIA